MVGEEKQIQKTNTEYYLLFEDCGGLNMNAHPHRLIELNI